MEMLIYWIWFSQLGISNRQKMALLAYFHDPEEIYHAQVLPEGVPELPDKDLSAAHKILETCADKGIRIAVLTDRNYPVKLRNIPDPPLVLYYKGMLPNWERMPAVGIVGTRKASAYGLTAAKRFGYQIAMCGGLVVSGGAYGIDSVAMQGALEAGKKTVGVLGCGVDVVYPKSNGRLFNDVLQNGCLISEYPPGTRPNPWQFPERNRIISGIASGVLVVEAPSKSGALITARDALEQGRDVYVVPGNIDVESCAGSNSLLQDGAMAVFTGWDVVKQYEAQYPGRIEKYVPSHAFAREQVFAQVAQGKVIPTAGETSRPGSDKKSIDKGEKSPYSVLNEKQPALLPEEQTVVAALSAEPRPVDEVIAQCGMPAGKVLTILTRLSLKGAVKNHPGKRVSK